MTLYVNIRAEVIRLCGRHYRPRTRQQTRAAAAAADWAAHQVAQTQVMLFPRS